jgi:hypothetical protein
MCTVVGGLLFVAMLPVLFGVMWISHRLLKSESLALVFWGIYFIAAFIPMSVNRMARCPLCSTKLSFTVPFSGKCQRCKTPLRDVRV